MCHYKIKKFLKNLFLKEEKRGREKRERRNGKEERRRRGSGEEGTRKRALT